jgi:hypothetical protein
MVRSSFRCEGPEDTMSEDDLDGPRLEDPDGALERAFISEFLRERGHDARSVARLPDTERDALLRLAEVHAANRLAEVHAKAHLLDTLDEPD